MYKRPEPIWIVRNLTCSSCGSVSKVRMQFCMLQYDWTCSVCGAEGHYVRPEERMYSERMLNGMRM